MRRGPRTGLYTFVAVHSTALGPALGGCRMWPYPDSRLALRDVLNLSRAMTYKAAAAGLPLGGGKGVIMLPDPERDGGDRSARRRGEPGGRRRRTDALRDFAETVDALGGRYLTAEDVGTSSRDMVVISERTPHVTGLSRPRGGSGDPSPWTAIGVHRAIEVACEHALGSPSLAGRSVAVVGLGHVGARLAALCAKSGARLLVSDVDEGRRAVARELGAEWLAPDRALEAGADVLAPCALGGVLDDDTIPHLRCAIVAGAANNQLADDRLARTLADRGVLWVPDFVANAGGIANISAELEPEGYDPRRARRRVLAIGDTLRRVLESARTAGTTPLDAALALARERLGAAG